MKNREIEAKVLLTSNIYQKIITSFPVKADFKQENYYFETTNDTLKKHDISLRIRIYEDHAEQTMKVPDPNPVQKDFHEVVELTDKLALNEAQARVKAGLNHQTLPFNGVIGDYLKERLSLSSTQLDIFTWSKTRRILLKGPKNCELTLDQTYYPDGYCDYELEIENTDPQLIQEVKLELEHKFAFSDNHNNQNQSKIARAAIHRK
ncbi:Adenylate cyclase [Lactobacillus gigeriorum DSM 23908 = CRBIP 24.85]|uniref:Adenylate cyclase n=2 Tax=Lactobacillus TaxID=1578 RepID=I7J359_9LACO|nr:Adenylate cyclase family protein [Lactobacillus gigeriorum DSM 23908 = CRBIP 24.85]CCI87342.1 Adenylate cyclase [Lactobacillus gigeriorum DSM 23908 = CRBIP 24.85]